MVPISRLAAMALGGLGLIFNTAQADPKWPPLNANEFRREIPVNIGGTLFFSGRYVYDVPRYDLNSLHRTDSYNQESFEWWAQVPIGDPRGIDARIQRQPAATPSTLPSLPPLPLVKRLPPATPAQAVSPALPLAAPPPSQITAPIGKLPPLAPPSGSKLPNLPSLPPLQ